MKFSLLYKIPEEPNYEAITDMTGALYDLSLDQCVHEMCSSKKQADYFLDVLKRPLHIIENVRYRQAVLKDLLLFPELLNEMNRLFKRYDTIQDDWKEMRANIYTFGVNVSKKALLEYTFSQLQVTAKFSKMIIDYFYSLQEILVKYEVTSEGLINIRNYCGEMIENESFKEIVDIASHFLYYTPEKYEFSVITRVDDDLRVRVSDLCDAVELQAKQNAERPKNLLQLFRKPKDKIPESAVEGENLDDAEVILNEAVHRMYTVLTDITNNIYELFYGFSKELLFYNAAVTYCGFLRDHHMPAAMPTVLEMEKDEFDAKDLYDFLLLFEGKAPNQIVTNNVQFGAGWEGLLVRGVNSSGKTVYLRSIGTAQIFAQAGLPICGRSARISVRDAIFTQFSSAEKEFVIGDTAGRFEGEVQLISHIVERVQPYSLILLNETFQTTAYSEGTVGIYNILSVLHRINAKFLFVTHLTHLYDLCDPKRIKLMQSGDQKGPNRYKILETESV